MTHLRILALAAILLAFLTLPAWAAQDGGTAQDDTAQTGAAQESVSSGLASWWRAQETWQQWLYGLGPLAVLLVVLQIRYRWIQGGISAVPRWWKSGKIFLVEVKGEWGKVTKPSKNEVVQTTIVVVVVSVIFAVYLWASDWVIMTAYQEIFKKLGL